MEGQISGTGMSQVLSGSISKGGEMEKSKFHWGNQSRGDCMDLKKVKLVVPASTGVPELFRFAIQLNRKLRRGDSFGSLVRTVPSQSYGTAFEVLIGPLTLDRFLDSLSSMSEVERVDDDLSESTSSNPAKKFQVLLCKILSPQVEPQKPEETGVAKKELVAV